MVSGLHRLSPSSARWRTLFHIFIISDIIVSVTVVRQVNATTGHEQLTGQRLGPTSEQNIFHDAFNSTPIRIITQFSSSTPPSSDTAVTHRSTPLPTSARLAAHLQLGGSTSSTLRPVDKRDVMESFAFPVTFRSAEASASTRLKIYSTFTISMKVRTLQSSAMLLYSGSSQGADFIALDVVDGRPRYAFDTGSGPRQIFADNKSALINDGEWHTLKVIRSDISTFRGHALSVDEVITYDVVPPTIQGDEAGRRLSVFFDLDGELHIGRHPRHQINNVGRILRSPTANNDEGGFSGCMASLQLNGIVRNILDQSFIIRATTRDSIVSGCNDPSQVCAQSKDLCMNGGRCIQQWSRYWCDCDMTSYSGPTCTDESVTYEFGSRDNHMNEDDDGDGGLVTFTYPSRDLPDTRIDRLALGVVTKPEDSWAAVMTLCRVSSGSSPDFIELQLVDGSALVMYNVGSGNHAVTEPYIKVNDGKYHVIEFTRSGANATLRIDENQPIIRTPTGIQLTTFNHQALVQVGGSGTYKDGMSTTAGFRLTSKPFKGTISGLVWNEIRVFELASKNDSRTTVIGNVDLRQQRNIRLSVNNEFEAGNGFGSIYWDSKQINNSTSYEIARLKSDNGGSRTQDHLANPQQQQRHLPVDTVVEQSSIMAWSSSLKVDQSHYNGQQVNHVRSPPRTVVDDSGQLVDSVPPLSRTSDNIDTLYSEYDEEDQRFNSINGDSQFYQTSTIPNTVNSWTHAMIRHVVVITCASILALVVVVVMVTGAGASYYYFRRRRGQRSYELARTASAAAARRGYHPCRSDDAKSRCRDYDVDEDDDVIVKSANGIADVDSGSVRKYSTDSCRRQRDKKNKNKYIFAKEWYV